jgi:hypothetical protein
LLLCPIDNDVLGIGYAGVKGTVGERVRTIGTTEHEIRLLRVSYRKPAMMDFQLGECDAQGIVRLGNLFVNYGYK